MSMITMSALHRTALAVLALGAGLYLSERAYDNWWIDHQARELMARMDRDANEPLLTKAMRGEYRAATYGGWSVVLTTGHCNMPEVLQVKPEAMGGVYGSNIELCYWVDGDYVYAATEGGTKMVIPLTSFAASFNR